MALSATPSRFPDGGSERCITSTPMCGQVAAVFSGHQSHRDCPQGIPLVGFRCRKDPESRVWTGRNSSVCMTTCWGEQSTVSKSQQTSPPSALRNSVRPCFHPLLRSPGESSNPPAALKQSVRPCSHPLLRSPGEASNIFFTTHESTTCVWEPAS